MMRTSGAALAATLLSVSFAAAQVPPADIPIEEEARLTLLDTCVIGQSRARGMYAADHAAICRCATDRMMPTMSAEDMQAVRKWKKVTRAMTPRWDEAMAGCAGQ